MASPSKLKRLPIPEERIHGLRLRALSDGVLEVKCDMGGHKFECTIDKHHRVRATSLPMAIAWAVCEDIEGSSLEQALAKLPKRLKAYVLRRQQIEDTERKHASSLLGRKLQTAGSFTFVRMDLALRVDKYTGVLRLELWYDDFSVHPTRIVVMSRGEPEFMDLVSEKVDNIRELMESSLLDKACDVLCS